MKDLQTDLPRIVRRRITWGFVMALLMIALGFALTLYSYSRYGEESDQLRHVYSATNRLSRILTLLVDLETGARGYMATKDPLFMESFEKALPHIPKEIKAVRESVAYNPEQIRNIDSLETLIDAKVRIINQQVKGVQTSAPVSILRAYLLLGKAHMDRVRALIEHINQIEEKSLQLRSDQANQTYQNTFVIIVILSLLTFVTVIGLYNLLEKELVFRHRTELQLRAYEDELKDKIRQLETSNEELERFAFVASHDMQEPLRKIQSFGNLIYDRYAANLTGEGELYLGKILQSAERMSKMIKDLLNFSRISSKKESFRLTSISDVIQGITSDQELRIKAANAVVELGELPCLEAIPSQMDHLFSNLISNALKFTKPDEQPIIKIDSEAIDGVAYPELFAGKKYFRIIVQDNGIGFEEKYIDHIFKIFQRLHGKTAYEGTGIGLAICKRIVSSHNGIITARSQPGVGTTFIIVLPEKQIQSIHDSATTYETDSYFIGG